MSLASADLSRLTSYLSSFFFNDTATTEIYTLSLHDALPISLEDTEPTAGRAVIQQQVIGAGAAGIAGRRILVRVDDRRSRRRDRKSTRLNSSHANISYAVFCLKKKERSLHQPVHVKTCDLCH